MSETSRSAERLPFVLFLAHRVPYPPDKGDRIRTFNLLRFLAARANVLLGCLADEPIRPEQVETLRQLCRDVCIVDNAGLRRWVRGGWSFLRGRTVSEGAFYHPQLQRQVETWLEERPVQACLLSASSLAPFVHSLRNRRIPLVVDLIDVDSQKWLDYAAVFHGWKRWIYRREGDRLRRLEIELARRSHGLTLVSEAECRLFRTFCTEGDVRAVPNGVDLDYFSPQPATVRPNSCVFVGAMDYPPNVDAVVWFAEEVWPALRKAQPQATFAIVGRQPTDAVRQLANLPGIEVVGSVPDVRTHLAQSSVAIAPLRIARGIQNKVLEALAMGLPVVASSAAMEGLEVVDGRELLRADSAEEWVNALLDLWRSTDRRRALGEAGRRYVEARHAWSTCLQEFSRLLGLPTE